MISPRSRPKISFQRRLVLVTPPLTYPISPQDWETTLKVKVNIQSPDVIRRIKAATSLVELYINRCLVAQTWDMFLDDQLHSWPAILQTLQADSMFYGYSIELRRPPMLAVQGVYVRDDFGTETLVDPATYWVSDNGDPGRISLQQGAVWPYHRGFMGFRVRFTSGYVYPFTCDDAGNLTAPGHSFVNGQTVRVQMGQSSALASPLQEDTDYVVQGVNGNVLQLFQNGSLVTTAENDSYDFLSSTGGIPEAIRRAIVISSALEIGSDTPNKIAGSGRYAPVVLPITASDLLESYRFYTI